MAVKVAVLLFCLGVWATLVDCQLSCTSQIICGDCISQPGCAWCSEESFAGVRCQPAGNLSCLPSATENPSSSLIGRRTSTPEPGAGPRTIDVDDIAVNLRVGDPQTFTVTVTPQRNLPLDLYIVMDLSLSMRPELETVQNIANQIADRVRNVTTNVRLGFGTFIDKPTQPYVQEDIFGNLARQDVHAFRHVVNMTSNSTQFSEQISTISVTSNIDIPENGLEALAQVITCEDIIGWRQRLDGIGTRLVLFMTDEEFHFAGEGRLAGIVNPYTGNCLLSPNTGGGPVEFTRALEFDYPSPGRILDLLQQFDVVTIFAIEDSHTSSYEALAAILNATSLRAVVEGFTVTQGGDTDAQDRILNIIGDQYERLLQVVSLDTSDITANLAMFNATVEVTPTCPQNSMRVEDGCASVPLEAPVPFQISVTLNSCEGLQNGQVISRTITTSSFGSFKVNFTVICNCGCAPSGVRDPSRCMNMGVMRCGVCECDPGKCGIDCSINIGDRAASDCPRNELTNERCSGRGVCACTCDCTQPENEQSLDPPPMVFGEACECDNFRCQRDVSNGQVCSGRGMCCDGLCRCDNSSRGNPYRGAEGSINDCGCEPVEEVCIDPDTGILCNNRGNCGCNFCICTNSNYTGTFCDVPDVSTCNFEQDEMCIDQCRDRYPNEANLPDICTECNVKRPLLFISASDITSTGLVGISSDIGRIASGRLGDMFSVVRGACEYINSDNCATEYYIVGNETHYAVVAVRELDCLTTSFPIPIWALAPIILGCLLILGILVVILIKIIFTILDYVDFKRWQRDAQGADFSKNTNPLYQSPEMKYENVAYGKE